MNIMFMKRAVEDDTHLAANDRPLHLFYKPMALSYKVHKHECCCFEKQERRFTAFGTFRLDLVKLKPSGRGETEVLRSSLTLGYVV